MRRTFFVASAVGRSDVERRAAERFVSAIGPGELLVLSASGRGVWAGSEARSDLRPFATSAAPGPEAWAPETTI
jgi:hypothetical protein